MAKRPGKQGKSEPLEPSPEVKAGGTWLVHRPDGLQPLSVSADQLDVTESGALVFIVGSADAQPHVVVSAEEYLYCTKIR